MVSPPELVDRNRKIDHRSLSAKRLRNWTADPPISLVREAAALHDGALCTGSAGHYPRDRKLAGQCETMRPYDWKASIVP